MTSLVFAFCSVALPGTEKTIRAINNKENLLTGFTLLMERLQRKSLVHDNAFALIEGQPSEVVDPKVG
jgi:hypothetical protein